MIGRSRGAYDNTEPKSVFFCDFSIMCAIKIASDDFIVAVFFEVGNPLTYRTVMNRDDLCDLLGGHASLEELEGEAMTFGLGFTGEGAGVCAGHQRTLSCRVPTGKRSTTPDIQIDSEV